MLRTSLVVAFLLLALVAPVWIPVRSAKGSSARPVAARVEEND